MSSTSIDTWNTIEATLRSPLQTDDRLENVLLGIQTQIKDGQQVPKHIAKAISELTFGPHNTAFLTDLAADVLRLCNAQPRGTPLDCPQPRGRKRRLVDGLTVGSRVIRWQERAFANEMDTVCLDCGSAVPVEAHSVQVEGSGVIDAPAIIPGANHRTSRPAWVPGQDVRGFVGRGKGGRGKIGTQAQVLMVNCYMQLQRLAKMQLTQLRQSLSPVGLLRSTSHAAQVASALLRVPARTIENMVAHIKKHGKPMPRPRVFKRSVAEAAAEGITDNSAPWPKRLRTRFFCGRPARFCPLRCLALAAPRTWKYLQTADLWDTFPGQETKCWWSEWQQRPFP